MPVRPEYRDYVADLLSGFGDITIRSMFGGAGIFKNNIMFGLIAYEILYFKVDKINQPDYDAEGMDPFTYEGKGKPIRMSYWQLPEHVIDEPEEFIIWADKAYEAALRANRKKIKNKKT